MNLLLKILRIPQGIRWRYYRIYNRLLFYAWGVKLGKCPTINNKVSLSNHGVISIGDHFTLVSGITPIAANLNASIAVARGGG